MQPDPAVMDRWSGSAPYWEKHRETIRQMFAPVTDALIEDAAIGSGQTVLDIATGPGEPALGVAAAVGPEGRVVGIDPIPEMVAAARRAAERMGFRNAQFEVAFADKLPFADKTFDAVISRFGAMFFPSPGLAIGQMLRVLKPEGRLALAVWGSADRNPFFSVLEQVIERFIPPTPPDPDAPDAFRFAQPGKLRGVMAGAGVAAPAERILDFAIAAPISAEDFWTVRTEMSERLRGKLEALPEEQREEMKRQTVAALRPYVTSDGISFPSQVLIVRGLL